MTIQEFKNTLQTDPSSIVFTETMQLIDDNYNFTPTSFTNGELQNKEGENSGSCKLFAFAILNELTKEETLACFGEHYQNVLEDSEGNGHQNIRNFIKTGFNGLVFDTIVLQAK